MRKTERMHKSQVLRRTYRYMRLIGVDPLALVSLFQGTPRYVRDAWKFCRHSALIGSAFHMGLPDPILNDWKSNAGTVRGHYFHQDLYVARRIFEKAPERHVDIGSRLDGFVAHVASFREIEVFDVRPLPGEIHNIVFKCADIMSELGGFLADYTDSLSCLHALEHFGLGRYGDTIRSDGHVIGLRNMSRMLRRGGSLYLSVPIGSARVEFNSQRVFALSYLLSLTKQNYIVESFSYVDDAGDFYEDASLEDRIAVRNSFGCRYGLAILDLTKK